jgi:hypothetical protein
LTANALGGLGGSAIFSVRYVHCRSREFCFKS